MRKVPYVLLTSWFLFAKSSDATLTIYKDGTALIKQPVAWSIPSGDSYVTWSGLPDGIHKDTPFLNLDGADILSQRFNDNVFSGADYFKSLRGEQIQVKPKEGKLVKGTLLEINSSAVTISHQSGVITFNRNELEFIGNKKKDILEPFFHPYLSWNLKSKSNKSVEGELVYKSNNFSWNTVYRLKMVNEEKGTLIAEAVISNSSNMDFKNALLQLVEGNLNKPRTKEPPRLERMNHALSMPANGGAMSRMVKDELGDYHIYSLNETHDLGGKENITVRMYGPLDVGYEKKYVFENTERRQKEEPLEVQLTMDNTESNGLGISLPGKRDSKTI